MIVGTLKPSPTGGLTVYIGGVFLDPAPSQAIYNHSPDGFAWGYGGSGPAQLALAILLHFSNEQIAAKYYQQYKTEVVANLDPLGFQIPHREVKRWLAANAGWKPEALPELQHPNAKRRQK